MNTDSYPAVAPGETLDDTAAMAWIHAVMSGREWSADTLDDIGHVVEMTGREIAPPA